MRLFTLALLLTAATQGCGSDPAQQQPVAATGSAPVASEPSTAPTEAGKQSTTPETSAVAPLQSFTLDTIADLPLCDISHDRQLVYVLETQQFHTCKANQWQAVDIKGKDGAVGTAGEAGEDGLDGNDNHIKMIVTCSPLAPPTLFKMRYQYTEMTSGDVMVTADLWGSPDENFSSTQYYSAKQTEKDSGELRIQHDVSGSYNGGYVKYLYNRQANTLTFSIHDSDYVAPLITSWTSQSSACAKQTF